MTEIKLVVTDIDGTLVATHSHLISDKNLVKIEGLEKSGCHVAIATARPPEYARNVVINMGLRGLHIVDGGASIYDYDRNEYVWREWLSVSTLKKIAVILIKYAQEVVDLYPDFRLVKVSDFDLESVIVHAPYAYTKIRPEDWSVLSGELAEITGISVSIVARDNDLWHVQVCSEAGNKKHGVAHLQELLEVLPRNTLAIGDNDNDEPLFESAHVRVAMGNATERLKALANYVTDSVENDGWAEAMDHFIR